MKINNKYVKTYLQIVTKWKKTKQNIPLGVRHVSRCPSLTENNSLTETFVFVFEAEKKRAKVQSDQFERIPKVPL